MFHSILRILHKCSTIFDANSYGQKSFFAWLQIIDASHDIMTFQQAVTMLQHITYRRILVS